MKPTLTSAACGAILCAAAASAGADEGNFIGYMTHMQYFAHKLSLAIASGNEDLQHFYAHEVEEQIKGALEVERLGDVPVAKLMQQFLVPRLEELEKAIDAGDAVSIDAAYGAMIDGCNRCHNASQRPYIKVERRTDNPYMQSFAK
jgi:hypothetical protein